MTKKTKTVVILLISNKTMGKMGRFYLQTRQRFKHFKCTNKISTSLSEINDCLRPDTPFTNCFGGNRLRCEIQQ